MNHIEDKIFETLDNNLDYIPHCITGMGVSSKLIASLITEFITWFVNIQDNPFGKIITGQNDAVYINFSEGSENRYSLDDIFNYWLKNVKK